MPHWKLQRRMMILRNRRYGEGVVVSGFRVSAGAWERIATSESHKEDWLRKSTSALKKVREWSELVAGPKWKTFIRRFNKPRSKPAKFQYDPVSYALNFVDGFEQSGNLDNGHPPGFLVEICIVSGDGKIADGPGQGRVFIHVKIRSLHCESASPPERELRHRFRS